jgi:hypothetical protein
MSSRPHSRLRLHDTQWRQDILVILGLLGAIGRMDDLGRESEQIRYFFALTGAVFSVFYQ